MSLMKKISTRFFVPLFIGVALLFVWTSCEDQSFRKPEDLQPQISESSPVAGEAIEDQYIVVLKKGTRPSKVLSEHGMEAQHVYHHAINGFSLNIPNSRALEALGNNKNVEYIEKDLKVKAFAQTLPTGVDRIQADLNSTAAIDNTHQELDVDIVILDTGIDDDHPDLNVAGGYNFSRGPSSKWDDGNGHGTHTAGSAAAMDNSEGVVGVAPGARLWAAKVLDNRGSGSISDIIAGIDWITQNADKFEVANMSLGATGSSSSMREAIQSSVNAGVVYVVAAGNDGSDVYGSDGQLGGDDDIIPAAYPEVATISALADSDGQAGGSGSETSYGSDDSFASFSNYSTAVTADNPVSSPGAAIDLMLPGVDIYSTYKGGDYTTMSGTSMSSPHGAGLAALYIVANNSSHASASDVYSIRQALIDAGVKQSGEYGLATQNDPDDNPEHLGWASSSSSGAPSVSWVNPNDGETVSGTVTLEVNASDADGSVSQVEFFVDGSLVGTDIDGSDGWTTSWETGTDGEYTLKAVATDNDNNTGDASITVTVNNTDDAPTISWINPTDGETVSGTVTMEADASDDGSVTQVEFFVDGSSVGTDSDGSDGWTNSWDSNNVADGDHTFTAEATDDASQTSSAQINVTVSNTTSGGGMFVSDISFRSFGPHLGATVTIRYDSDGDGVAESSDDPVSNASVSLTLDYEDGTAVNNYSGTTDDAGQIEFKWKQAPSGSYEAEVTELTHTSYTWDPSLDLDNPDYYTLQ